MKPGLSAAIFAVLALLASCSNSDNGEPTVGSGGEPSVDLGGSNETGTNSGSGADVEVPEVSNPIQNLTPYKEDPCTILSPQQAKSIGFPRPEDATHEESQPGCRWLGHRDSRVTITIQSGEQWALAGYYEVHAERPDAYAYFNPVTIEGFPAVFATDFDQRENGGSCAMTVALTDQDVLRMSNGLHFGTAQRDKPCAQLREAAELAVKTISAGK